MIIKALTLFIALSIGIGTLVPAAYVSAESGSIKPLKHRKKYRKYRKYSKRWWRAYRQRVRQRKAAVARKRALRLRLIRLAYPVAPQQSSPKAAEPTADQNGNLRLLIEGEIVKIYDGGTVGVRTEDGTVYRVGMLGVEAPALKKPIGRRAGVFLSRLIFGKAVTVMIRKKIADDTYLGTVYYGGEDINLKQIENGMGRYRFGDPHAPIESDRRLYERAEQNARAERSGLWRGLNAKDDPCEGRIQSAGNNCRPGLAARRKTIGQLK